MKDRRLSFRHFAGAYVGLLVVLLLLPSRTIPGQKASVSVREAEVASPVDLAFHSGWSVGELVSGRPSAPNQTADPSLLSPVRISLPALGIEGEVAPVGISADRQLDVPAARTAGWYQHSAPPAAAGEPTSGATVIAAHVDFAGKPGLFFNLRLTEIGDLIEVQALDGTVLQYRVTEVTLYDKTELPSAELFRTSGDHALHLVTCGGRFDANARSYQGNQVVTALPT